MARNWWENELRKAARQKAEQENGAEAAASAKTKAGGNQPAFGVLGSRIELPRKAKNFADYTSMRRQLEEKNGMQSAADKLAAQFGYQKVGNQVVYRTPFSPLPTPTKENTATRAKAPGAYGIKPAAYVDAMRAVAKYMDIQQNGYGEETNRYLEKFFDGKLPGGGSEQTYDAETTQFLNKYFDGKLPNETQFKNRYMELVNSGAPEDELMGFHVGRSLIEKALQNQKPEGEDEIQKRYEQLLASGAPEEELMEFQNNTRLLKEAAQTRAEAKSGYNAAIELLGEDAPEYLSDREADYYERYLMDYGAYGVADDYAAYKRTDGRTKSDGLRNVREVEITSGVLNPDVFGKSVSDEFESGQLLAYRNMPDKQRAAYLSLAGRYGGGTAINYFDTLLREDEYNKQAYETRDAALRKKATEMPGVATAQSILHYPGQIAGTGYAIGKAIKGEEIDPYNQAFAPGQMVQTPREQVQQDITTKHGKVDEETGEIQDTFGSGVRKAAYSGLTSLADSLYASLLGGGVPGASTLIQGGMQYGNTAQDVTMRGGNLKQATWMAALDAGIEAATEYIPAENLIKALDTQDIRTVKDFAKNIFKNILGEAPGEGFSELGSAAADKMIMQELSEWDQTANAKGKWAAAKDLLNNVGVAMMAGAMSGGASGTLGSTAGYINTKRDVNAELAEAARQKAEIEAAEQAKTEPAAVKPPAAEPVNRETQARAEAEKDFAMDERAGMREEREAQREYTPQPAQEEQKQAETPEREQQQPEEERTEEMPSEGKKPQMFSTPRAAALTAEDREGGSVNVVGVMMDEGTPVFVGEEVDGENEYFTADELMFDDDAGELLAYEGIERMDARALRNYLEGYDKSRGTAEDYANAYSSVYQRAKSGVDYEQAALANNARQYLSDDAMIDAFAAGQAAYNQTHETVQPAAVETVSAETAPDNAMLSVREPAKTGKISKQYTSRGWATLSKEGRQKAIAQMSVLQAIASRTGRTIAIVDSIVGKDGKRANAMYNPETGEIRVALDAQEGAYAYAAMHELTHAMKHEHAGEWAGFVDFVKSAVQENGQNWDVLVQYQMDRFGYTRAVAEEEVMCNTVPALLKDERNVLKLYKGNRKLFDRVVDWVKSLLKDIKAAGDNLSKRSESWKQMDALAADRKTLQEMYDRMMAAMEKPAKNVADTDVVKLSAKDSDKLTKTQYDHFGWIRANNVLSAKTYDNLMHKYSGVVKNNDYAPKSADGYYLIEIGDEFGVNNHVVAMKGGVTRPVIDRVYSIALNNETRIEVPRRSIIENEARYGRDAHEVIQQADEIGVVRYFDRSYAPDYYQYAEEYAERSAGGKSRKGAETAGRRGNGTGSTGEGKAADEVRFSMQDSEGNDLTEEQQEYFADSKVRDNEGNLMVVYHGTPSGKYEKFKSSTYFTPMEWYADVYQNPSASSISYGKKNDAPMTYKAYLNIKKPFDTRKPKERKIFMQEYYRQWGTGAPLSASGLPDWTDGMDLQEFIEEMDYDYDGLILDEGGVPDDKGGVISRGLSYVIFEPEQAKLVENKTPTDDERFRYSMRDTDENVQDALSAEQKAFAQVKGHRINAAEADKLAGEVLRKANSDYDRHQLAAEISRIYDYIERGEDVDWDQVDDEMTRLMAKVMEKSRTLDLEHESEMEDLRHYLKNARISLSPGQVKEAANKAGSYGGYRKLVFGRVNLTRTGTGLDQLWTELSDLNPELFPRDATEGDQPILLLQAVDAIKPKYHTGMGMNVEESATWMAGYLNEAYFSLPAVKAAAKTARTFADSVRDLKAAMKRFEETSWSEYQNALKTIREARGNQQRTKKQEETAAMREKYVKWRERDTAARKEREMKNRYRVRIERTAGTLANWIAKPTDAKHVPANVEDSIKAMLKTLDFSGKDTKVAATLTGQLERVATEIERAQKGSQEGNEGAMYFELDQQMIDQIRLIAERIRGNTSHQQMEGRGVYELNGMELKELSKWLDVLKHVLTNASKMRGSYLTAYSSVAEVQQASYTELRKKKPWTAKKWLTKAWEKYFGADMLDSFTFFERLGPTANAVFKGLRDGFDEVTQHLRTAEEFSQKIFEGLKLKELTGKKAKKYDVELSDGETVQMTKGEMMAIYVLSRRDQARGHMYAERNGEGIRLRSDENPDPHQLTAKDEKTIFDMLTADEKKAAEGMQAFLSRECASWGNETSMKLLGYRKFGEEYYWPIATDERTKNNGKLEENFDANISAIMNQGMTKATIEGAKNAIVIDDIFDSYTKHISNMAAYSAYAIPLSDFNKWYNNTAVRRSIAKVMGPKGEEYIKNFIMALNGSARPQSKTGVERALSTMNRNAKTASVGLNARVVIQQPTSIARASMYISPKYLAEAAAHKAPKAELINKYCGIAAWKDWGFFETNVGPNLKEMLTGTTTGMAALREKSMVFAAMMDQWTMNRLWVACELETKDLSPELKVGSEEYYKAVGKRMSEIVDRTQVVDSVFHRSQIMRSKSWMAQTLTNFMSEPTKTLNLLASAIYDYADDRSNKAALRRMSKAFGVVAVTGVLTAAASAVIDAFRDDEDEKKWLDKYLTALGSNTLDNLNPLGMLPLVKDVWSILQGYSNSNMAFQSVQKLVWGYEALAKYVQGEGKQNWYGVMYKLAQAGSSITGVPVSNLMRDINGLWQTVTGVSLTLKPEGQKSQRLNLLYEALENGNTARAKKLREELRLKAGMTPKEIDTALAKELEADSKIAEAYNAKAAKNYATMNRAINALTARGYGKEVVDKAISNYAADQKPKTEKAKDPGEQLAVTLYSEADVVSAMRVLAGLEKGSVSESDVRAMISERVAGSEAKDPEKTVKSGVTGELKKDYLAMEKKGDNAGMRKLGMVMNGVLGVTQDTMDGWVRDQHSENLRAAVDSSNEAAAKKAVNVMRTKDGKTDSEIKSSLSKYKQLYIDAVNRKNMAEANRIKRMLIGLGLMSKKGKPLYTEETFADWLKEK